VANAWCIPLSQGPGTVDVIIVADETVTGSEIPSSHALTGTTTAITENKLVDGAADFMATGDGGPVRIGDIAVNDDTGGQAVITAVDNATQLTLDTDIFSSIGQSYTLKSLTAQVGEYIDDVRPVTVSIVRVLPTAVTLQDVTMTVTGTVNKEAIASAITSLLRSLVPGQTLYLSRLIAIAIQEGATNAAISAPAADMSPGPYEMLRPGTITVS